MYCVSALCNVHTCIAFVSVFMSPGSTMIRTTAHRGRDQDAGQARGGWACARLSLRDPTFLICRFLTVLRLLETFNSYSWHGGSDTCPCRRSLYMTLRLSTLCYSIHSRAARAMVRAVWQKKKREGQAPMGRIHACGCGSAVCDVVEKEATGARARGARARGARGLGGGNDTATIPCAYGQGASAPGHSRQRSR